MATTKKQEKGGAWEVNQCPEVTPDVMPETEHYNRRSEQGLLGCLIKGAAEVVPELIKNCPEGIMYAPEHTVLLTATLDCYGDLQDVDGKLTVAILMNYLDKHQLTEKAGGADYILDEVDKEPSAVNWRHYRDQLLLLHQERQLRGILSIAGGNGVPIADRIAKLVDAVSNISVADKSESWLEVVTLSDVEPEDIEYLWQDIIPIGMIISVVSLEGVGKGHLASDIIARVTAGIPWPDTPNTRNQKGDVVLYSREEHLTKTILPRLLANGADVSRVHVVQAVKSKHDEDRMFELEYNMPELDKLMEKFPKTKLVVFDPITQYVAGNENSNHDIQRALDKLNAFAERHNVAVIMLSHLNKKENDRFINRTIGSRAWSAGPRMIWGLEFDPNSEEDDVYMACMKTNIGPKPRGFRFHISGPTGKGKVYWDIARNTRVMGESADRTTKMEECCQWLKEKLTDDAKVPATDIFEAGDELGFNPIMLKRAKKELAVISIKEGFGKDSVSYWQNPIIHTVAERVL